MGYAVNTWRGENLVAGTETAAYAFQMWKESPGHNANMLGEHYTVIGIARDLRTQARRTAGTGPRSSVVKESRRRRRSSNAGAAASRACTTPPPAPVVTAPTDGTGAASPCAAAAAGAHAVAHNGADVSERRPRIRMFAWWHTLNALADASVVSGRTLPEWTMGSLEPGTLRLLRRLALRRSPARAPLAQRFGGCNCHRFFCGFGTHSPPQVIDRDHVLRHRRHRFHDVRVVVRRPRRYRLPGTRPACRPPVSPSISSPISSSRSR